ncbi:MAG: class I SAM-dependent methyltransferase [Elusimicrobiota bacterium]|jgi:hypothetical protein|nr:class I SAM-dependent methyltransferase [Elusimicrobiota bacterium]
MKTTQLVNVLKENNQDFEFYPTTREMVRVIYNNLKIFDKCISILDIGAGNGNFFTLLREFDKEICCDKYAIEKSQILISALPADIMILGTDFYQQTLIDKQVDVIFCNPPYSEFEVWIERIIEQANAKVCYFVIPERWKDNKIIKTNIRLRNAKYTTLGSFDFLHSEFREARAKIDVIKIDFTYGIYRDKIISDPFDIFFEKTFKINADVEKVSHSEFKETKIEEIKAQIVKGQNLIERLEELYTNDLKKLLNNYRQIETLNAEILAELNIDIAALKGALKVKIKGLKAIYWQNLFDNIAVITDRLTNQTRVKMLDKLRDNMSIDFTVGNAYSLVLWAIKNANQYINAQLTDLYKELTKQENIINYKSNQKTFTNEDWRWNRSKNISHYKLDYRLVFTSYGNFKTYYSSKNNLGEKTNALLNDIITIAKNLNFRVVENAENFHWEAGKPNTFIYVIDGRNEIFMEVRAYINGNIHVKFCQEFMKAFNVEAGRLLGWIKDTKEAAEELNMDIQEAAQYFNRNNIAQIGNNIKLLA